MVDHMSDATTQYYRALWIISWRLWFDAISHVSSHIQSIGWMPSHIRDKISEAVVQGHVIHMHICMHMHTPMQMHKHTNMHKHLHKHTYMHIHAHTHIHLQPKWHMKMCLRQFNSQVNISSTFIHSYLYEFPHHTTYINCKSFYDIVGVLPSLSHLNKKARSRCLLVPALIWHLLMSHINKKARSRCLLVPALIWIFQ